MINKVLSPILSKLPENNRIERIWKLAQVDFKKRYYNDQLGLFWALLNPLFRIAVYYFVFTLVFKLDIENYALFLFAGILVWMTFTEASNKGLSVIKSKKYLILNIQFNHIDLFVSLTISVFLGFIFNIMTFLLFMVLTGIPITYNIVYIPLIMGNVFFICIGSALILAVIQIYIKDIVHAWSIITLAGFWSSGIFHKGELFLEIMPSLRYINPFVGIIMNMRNVTIYGKEPYWDLILINYGVGLVILLLGYLLYKNFSSKAIELM